MREGSKKGIEKEKRVSGIKEVTLRKREREREKERKRQQLSIGEHVMVLKDVLYIFHKSEYEKIK